MMALLHKSACAEDVTWPHLSGVRASRKRPSWCSAFCEGFGCFEQRFEQVFQNSFVTRLQLDLCEHAGSDFDGPIWPFKCCAFDTDKDFVVWHRITRLFVYDCICANVHNFTVQHAVYGEIECGQLYAGGHTYIDEPDVARIYAALYAQLLSQGSIRAECKIPL